MKLEIDFFVDQLVSHLMLQNENNYKKFQIYEKLSEVTFLYLVFVCLHFSVVYNYLF